MEDFTLERVILQSYFESGCNSFFGAYAWVKRLGTEEDELYETNPEELQVFNMLQDNSIPEDLRKNLEEKQKEVEKSRKRLEDIKRFWGNEILEQSGKLVETVISEMKEQKFSIIVTSREEVVTLMAFFMGAKLVDNEIIDVSENALSLFPNDEMSQEFLKAYLSKDDAEMEKVIKKYF